MSVTSEPDIKANYRCLLSQERQWARLVAGSILKPRPVSVWEVVVPVLLVFSYMSRKEKKEVMVQNLIFTKESALKAALERRINHLNREEALGPIKEKTRQLLTTVREGFYSEEIRRRQLQEIALLMDHYDKCLRAEGKTYRDLILNTYINLETYLAFLDQLKQAEKQVNIAALNTLGEKGNPDLVSRMEASLDRFRRQSAQHIFNEENIPKHAGGKRTSKVV